MKADVKKPRPAPPWRARLAPVLTWLRAVQRFLIHQGFSSISRRIVLLNLAGLLALVSGILYLSQFRAGLIDARVQSMVIQGEIIAGAIAGSPAGDPQITTLDRERLLELQAGESYGPEDPATLEFPINPERIAPILRRLVTPTNTRARIYDRDGTLLLDTRTLYSRGDILRFDLPSPVEKPSFLRRQWNSIARRLSRMDLPLYEELGPTNGKGYPEVVQASAGQNASVVRANDRGEVIVSVAVPVQRFRTVLGALLLSTQGGEIDAAVEAERFVIVRVFLVAAAVMVVLSFFLAGTIGGPVRRLAEAAEGVRRRIRSRIEIPDFTYRADEIGHLSGAIRDMTDSLYARIEAIESFAADIADASRLDADLQRDEAVPVDVERLLEALVTLQNEVPRDDAVRLMLTLERAPGAPEGYVVPGHESRLGQVMDNLVTNARSFSPKGGTVRIACRRLKYEVEIVVDDDGPGIRSEALARIFERFYTDRPEHGFGQNSGLGLSISKQIVEGHGGRVWAENRMTRDAVAGARFIVRLPAA